jgi:hypothetical protein
MEHGRRDPRVRQLVIGISILVTLFFLIPLLLIGWRKVPGLAGEWLGLIVGLMSTPFLLEGSFLILGLVIVITVNQLRQRKEGDEFVILEQIDGHDLPTDLPDQAKWAVYRNTPLAGVEPTLLERAEGALAIGDFDTAAACIGEMSGEDLKSEEICKLRIHLARATGKLDLAAKLQAELERS